MLSLCSFQIERASGKAIVLGIDEVGRGCLAGPVVAAGVIFRLEDWDEIMTGAGAQIQDSKKLSPKLREKLSEFISAKALFCKTVSISETVVDEINILQATLLAARRVVEQAQRQMGKIDLVLMDGSHPVPDIHIPQKAVVSGDQFSKSIAAASIMAKVFRDQWMTEMAPRFPNYGFDKHKGYATTDHRAAIKKFGPCEIHRRTFLSQILGNHEKGARGESLAKTFLMGKGFKILTQNWRFKGGEIDIIAEKGGQTHFFEVRSRIRAVEIQQIFPFSKQRQFFRSVEAYRAFGNRHSHEIRFHFLEVVGEKIQPRWDVFGLSA